jgi:hypothetical protein
MDAYAYSDFYHLASRLIYDPASRTVAYKQAALNAIAYLQKVFIYFSLLFRC